MSLTDWRVGQVPSMGMSTVVQQFSDWGPWNSSISNTWTLVRNTDCGSPSQTCWISDSGTRSMKLVTSPLVGGWGLKIMRPPDVAAQYSTVALETQTK